MVKLKHITSYILLLVYSISFGHQLIPHHHHTTDEDHSHLHEGLHNHCMSEEVEHNHVAHENHFDEGLIDYIGCILGSHQHNPATECELLQVVLDQKSHKETTKRVVDSYTEKTVAFAIYEKEKASSSYAYSVANRLQYYANGQAKRGPPSNA